MRITDIAIVLGVAALAFNAAPYAIGAGTASIEQEAPTPSALLQTRLMSLDGEWQGSLQYRDYTSDEMVSIPLARSIHGSPGDNYLLFENTFTDPGYKVYGAEMIIPVENGIVIASSDSDGVVTSRLALESASEQDDDFRAVLTGTTYDNGADVPARYILTIGTDLMRFEKQIKAPGESSYRFRNAMQVSRVSR